jgi:ABC-type Fe3+/spermidine/putrescine transport system ATPase subunit
MPTGDQGLIVRGLRARAGAFELAPVDLAVGGGRVLVLLGPSGAGKTTLLDTIAGLRPAMGGTVHLAGQELTALPPDQRRIGVVFQRGALFPNLSVAENVRFGLRARREAGTGHADTLLSRLGLEQLADRSPRSLSGGETQRVALARALAIRPGLLLLDEPLSALDLPAREELRGTLQGLLADLAVPTVYVTHDRDEALSIGDDIAVLAGGGLRRAGTAREVAASPGDPAAARLLGWRELGRGRVSQGVLRIGSLTLDLAGLPGVPADDGLADVFYRPEDVLLGALSQQVPAAGHFHARIDRISPTVPLAQVSLAGPPAVTALLLHRQLAHLRLLPGTRADVAFPPQALHVIPVPGSD